MGAELSPSVCGLQFNAKVKGVGQVGGGTCNDKALGKMAMLPGLLAWEGGYRSD